MKTAENKKIDLDYSRLPPAPQVLIKLIDLFNHSEVSFKQLESIIEKDTALTTRVISVANSAAYSQWKNTRELKQILVVLGINTIKSITLTSAVHQFFSQFSNELGKNLGSLWLDALICAHLTRQLAIITGYNNPDEAHLAGLMHQLGQLVFLSNDTAEYQALMANEPDQNALLLKELQRYGIQSTDLAADIIATWELDSFLHDAVRYQYKSSELLQDAHPLVKLINLSSQLCNRINYSHNKYRVEDHFFGLNQSVIDDLLLQATQSAEKDASGFGIIIDNQSGTPTGNIDDETIRIELARRVRQIALLEGIQQSYAELEDMSEIMLQVSENLQLLFGISSCLLFFPDSEQSCLTAITNPAKTAPSETYYRIELKAKRSLITESAIQQSILDSLQQTIFDELPIIDRQILDVLHSPQFICLPLISNQTLFGVISIGCETHQLHRFQTDMELLQNFATIIANSISQQQQTLKEKQQLQQLEQQETQLKNSKIIHEINNPLTIINNYLEIISLKLDSGSDNKQHLETIKQEINRVGEILLQLKDDQEVDLAAQPEVDVNQLITNLNSLFEPTFYKLNQIQSHCELDPELPLIVTNQNKLKQIISNLLKNAAESLADKGKISITSKALVIVNNKKYIQITISDSGTGLPDSILENLFSPVQSTKGGNHSGLGLTIVNKLISELSGSISYSSSNSGGAEFNILLPRKVLIK